MLLSNEYKNFFYAIYDLNWILIDIDTSNRATNLSIFSFYVQSEARLTAVKLDANSRVSHEMKEKKV
jgi:hypothetical protein